MSRKIATRDEWEVARTVARVVSSNESNRKLGT